LRLAEAANLSLDALGRGPQRYELVIPEQHNLRIALDWATDADVELGLRLAIALESFWVTHDSHEGARRFEPLVAQSEGLDLVLRARAYRDYGGCVEWSGDYDRGEQAYVRSGELFREAGDESGVATSVFRRGVIASRKGDLARARRMWEEALETWRRLGDEIGELQALGNLGWLEHGDADRGRELVERSLAMARQAGWTWWEAAQLGNLAERALEDGRTDEGERRAREYLALAREIDDRTNTIYGLAQLAWVATDRGDAERAAVLWAAVEAEEARAPVGQWAPYREKYALHIAAAPRPGTALSLDVAVEYALGESDA
jgi:non-specific serine/threonine protein kinase